MARLRCVKCYQDYDSATVHQCATAVVPIIPPVESDVANQGTSNVQAVPVALVDADPVKKHQPFEYDSDQKPPLRAHDYADQVTGQISETPVVKRSPVDHMTANLYWPFIIMMGKIAMYAQMKYGSVEQYADGRLVGEKSPINHIAGHISEYVQRKPHDKFGNLQMQLAAIAYNAMMECVYLDQGGGPTVPSKLYDSVQKGQEK